jgi:hypothetical protein
MQPAVDPIAADVLASPIRVRRQQLVEPRDTLGIFGALALGLPPVRDLLEARCVDGEAGPLHRHHRRQHVALELIAAHELLATQPRRQLAHERDRDRGPARDVVERVGIGALQRAHRRFGQRRAEHLGRARLHRGQIAVASLAFGEQRSGDLRAPDSRRSERLGQSRGAAEPMQCRLRAVEHGIGRLGQRQPLQQRIDVADALDDHDEHLGRLGRGDADLRRRATARILGGGARQPGRWLDADPHRGARPLRQGIEHGKERSAGLDGDAGRCGEGLHGRSRLVEPAGDLRHPSVR